MADIVWQTTGSNNMPIRLLTKILYHGSPALFSEFDPSRVGEGDDQAGPGFYFTDDEETAELYAGRRSKGASTGFVYEVEVSLSKPIIDGRMQITKPQLAAVLRAAPEYFDMLMNFGDVPHEGETSVLRRAVDIYHSSLEEDAVSAIGMIARDFFNDSRAALLEALYRETGYDGIIVQHQRTDDTETHVVAWLAQSIEIVSTRPGRRADHGQTMPTSQF